MKKLLTILFVTAVAQLGFGQDTLIKSMATSDGATIISDGKLEIIIYERSTLTDNKYHIINNLIFVNKKIISQKKASQSDILNINNDVLYKKAKSIDLDNLNDKYVDNATANSDSEYEFIIKLDGKTYTIHVYKVKIKPLFNLVKMINSQLPEGSKIGYDKQYLD